MDPRTPKGNPPQLDGGQPPHRRIFAGASLVSRHPDHSSTVTPLHRAVIYSFLIDVQDFGRAIWSAQVNIDGFTLWVDCAPGRELCLPPAGMGHVSIGLVDRGRIEAIAETTRYHVAVVKQTTVRLPDDLAHDAGAVARLQGTSPN